MRRFRVLTDEQWERTEPLLPSNASKVGRPFGDHRSVVGAVIYRAGAVLVAIITWLRKGSPHHGFVAKSDPLRLLIRRSAG